MIKKFLAWLNGPSMAEQGQDMNVERELEYKKSCIDKSIARGKEVTDKLKEISDRQVIEAHVAMATIRGLLTLLKDKDEK